ncbi:MAG: guanylate kinase [Blastocatellia bacterium]|nr:guanylate kinase [Blastocatellia bacterium]MCS7156833.1 guanylate kinase [Blastocatellia bacterium]MCX7752791.1 guanylate kinase [Blastocatellia bacterium]MDW8167524.1 guanylate kinase [Acidobacteriota bacterium]MDW8256871.1 guanylate kinase [Acidobacteriota bacterium]
MSNRRGLLFIVSGPSGVGKSTLVNRAIARVPGLVYSVSYTTRPQRPTEVEGRDYYFVSRREFERMRAAGELIEWAEVYGHLYGRSHVAIERELAAGRDVILSIDVQGAATFRKLSLPMVSIFILPPSFEVLAERLRARKTDAWLSVEHRLTIAREEVRHYRDFDYVIVNDRLEEALALLEAVILAERHRRERLEEDVQRILQTFEGPIRAEES